MDSNLRNSESVRPDHHLRQWTNFGCDCYAPDILLAIFPAAFLLHPQVEPAILLMDLAWTPTRFFTGILAAPHESKLSIKVRMSLTRHAVVRGPSFMDLGKRPSLTPTHQIERLTGISVGMGGSALGLPMI